MTSAGDFAGEKRRRVVELFCLEGSAGFFLGCVVLRAIEQYRTTGKRKYVCGDVVEVVAGCFAAVPRRGGQDGEPEKGD